MSDLQTKGAAFAQKIFDDIREMSRDVQGVSRQAFSAKETEVLNYLTDIGRGLNLEITEDRAGNVWMTLPGQDRSLPAFVSGSHVDSVPQGGNYDGLAGVTAALTVAWWMREVGFQPKRDYTVLMMRGEESSFFGKAYMGSLGMLGKLTEKDLNLKIRDGSCTLGEAMQSCGIDTAAVSGGQPLVDIGRIAAFVELHIEQGPILEENKKDVGVVPCVLGMCNFSIRTEGVANHAGTTPMKKRKDALFAMAKVLLLIHEKLDKFDGLVYTTGEISIHPNVHTVIPDECLMSLDARHVDDKVIDEVKNILNNLPSTVEGCKVSTKLEWDRKTTYFHKTLVGYVEGACKELGYNYQFINSGAGHDAQFAAYMLPTTMIFVPSKDGRSHCDEEYSDIEHCYKSCNVLLNAVLKTDEEGV